MVKCVSCGMHFNERFAASHKRRAVRRRSATTEKETLNQIQSLFERRRRRPVYRHP